MKEYLKDFSKNHDYVYWYMRDASRRSKIVKKVLLDDSYLKSDISISYGLNKFGKPLFSEGTKELDSYFFEKRKRIKKVLPYLSYIQRQFVIATQDCKKGIYFNIEYQSFVYIEVNPKGRAIINKPVPDEAFMLVKAFTDIQETKTVPKYLIDYIVQQEALGLLEN